MLTFEDRHGPDRDDAPDYGPPVVPQWWRDAKLGLFVHWGLYSIPAFACPPGPRTDDADAYARHTYAEWYANTVRIVDSPTWVEHRRRYGDSSYEDLADGWDAARFDADALVADAVRWGARYVIPTTKHHDGFCLWDSATTDFTAARRCPRRDLIAEMAEAARRAGVRFGCYFSGALDWHVSGFPPITNDEELFAFRRNDDEFARYDRFRPAVLWNDIDWPDAGKGPGPDGLAALFEHYRRVVPDGVLDDRWGVPHRGHLTREYVEVPGIVDEPWEATRGLGHSFGFNRAERAEDRLSGAEAVRLLVDVVAKGGNLLFNVGPDESGVIPTEQRSALDVLGGWLATHGQAIYGTRPWRRHGEPDGSLAYTVGEDGLFVHVLDPTRELELPADLTEAATHGARWLDGLDVSVMGGRLAIPVQLRKRPVAVLRIPLPSGVSSTSRTGA